MEHFLANMLLWWHPLGYVLAFLLMIFEGDLALLLIAFLTHEGLFSLPLMIIAVYAGLLVGDSIWYYIGEHLGKRANGRFAKWVEHIAGPFDERILKKPFTTLLFAKFTYGFHRALIIRSGWIGLSYRTFLLSNIVAGGLWMLMVGALGYGTSATFMFLRGYLKYAEIALLAVAILYVGIQLVVRHYAVKDIEKHDGA